MTKDLKYPKNTNKPYNIGVKSIETTHESSRFQRVIKNTL